MNKLIAIAIALGLAFTSAVYADGMACNTSCAAEQTQCVTKLGSVAKGNCNDGFRICVQRCDPRRMNTAFLESDASSRTLHRRPSKDVVQACAGQCALSARTCVESGNGRDDCRGAQMACQDRCASS